MNKKLYLIIYDITDNKRRRKVSKILEKYGIRIQFSAFECELNEQKKKRIISLFEKIIKKDDSIRIYNLAKDIYIVNKGQRELFFSDNLCII
ncbi:MAG: CRISPR-associated endonuclease Cas2 [Oscillospiraceae bacterium]|nr:CRISPR-associated endonuclease Cas2 [Oscillospiraceae bacterium]MDD6085344.1 CRISPR-associated endonuclease Cas2 [Oscillospiraceae bacterium]